MDPVRPSLPRDAGRLLAIALIAAAALWVLARVRFPDRVPAVNPVEPILAQLTPSTAFEDVTSAVARLAPRLEQSIVVVPIGSRAGADRRGGGRFVAALRIRDDLAVTPPEGSRGSEQQPEGLVASDPVSRLAIVRVSASAAPQLDAWVIERPQAPRFLIATDVAGETPTFRPVFVGTLAAITSPLWPGPLWRPPSRAGLDVGSFLFTADGALIGLVVEREGHLAIVPGAVLLAMADRLVRQPPPPSGWLGVAVQPLTPALASATGATAGVIVAWVDPHGPAADRLAPGDVIDQVDRQAVETLEQWDARTAAVGAGASVAIGLRRGDEARTVDITAVAEPERSDTPPLGLTLRAIRGVGSAVVLVDPDSAGSRAGLQPGDVITLAADVEAPMPDEVARVFAHAHPDRPVLLGVSGGGTHRVIALEKRW